MKLWSLKASAAVCALVQMVPSSAWAQQIDEETTSQTEQATGEQPVPSDEPEIVVTGTYAESLRQAMDRKRDAATVQEILSISDLNQLPDVSIADALSRLPGLAADRDPNNGAKSQISLRGMGPQLTLGTLNGRDLATPTPDRNVRYDQFPSELIGGAVVYKAPMASIIEGGVAGSIDLSTVKPLDYKGRRISASIQGVYSEQGDQFAPDKKLGYRGSLSYIGQFADDTLGIAFGYAGRNEPYSELRTQHASYDPGGYTDYNADGVVDKTTYQLNQFLRVGDDERHGVVGVIQWNPSPAFNLTLDGLWSKVKIDGKINGVEARNVNQQFANVYTNPVIVGDHMIAATVTGRDPAGTFNLDVQLQNYAAIARRNDELMAFGGNLEFAPGDDWEANIDLAYSRVRYDADYYELRTTALTNQGGVLVRRPFQSVTYDGRNSPPTFSANFDLTDPNLNRPTSLTLPFLQIGRDDILTWKNDFIYNIGDGFLNKLRLGTRFVDRTKSNRSGELNISIPLANAPLLSGSEIRPYALGNYDGPQRGAAPSFLTFDFYDIADEYFGDLTPVETVASQAESWVVTERTMAGYAQLDFGGQGPLFGNIGLRVVQTDSRSSSIRRVFTSTTPDTVEPFTVTNNYTDWLPSLNLTYKASDEIQFRFGLAKTIARPAVEDLNAGFQAFDFGVPQAFGGNPLLEPFRANQADLGVEWYFGKNDFVALTGFYKDLKSYITTSTQIVPVDGVPYQFFQPVNASGGYIRGFEFTLQKQFDELPSPFNGLGVYANYAFVDSNVSVSRNFSEDTLGLIGLSEHTGTASVYYYKSGFEARVSYNYRSPYANVVDGGGFETTDGAGYLDAQVSYEFVKGFTGVLQASNILNTPYETYLGNNEGERGRYAEYGRHFYIGLRASF